MTYASIEFDQTEYRDFYLGFCNSTLWPLFHYFVDGFRYSDEHYEAYQRMNQRYARELMPLLEPDDLIWVHDFHLFPLAQRLREAGAKQPIGLFLHIPFPNVEVLRVLPVYGELLQAMLAYDVLGFQTETDRDAFRSAVAYVWGPQALASKHIGGDRRPARRDRRLSRSAWTWTSSSARPSIRWRPKPASAWSRDCSGAGS